MSEDTRRDWKTPVPGVTRGGVNLSWSAIWTLVLIAGGAAMTYIFATKAEVSAAVTPVKERLASVEKDTGFHMQAIDELKASNTALNTKVEAVDRKLDAVEINLRTVLTEIGVSSGRIAKPK